MVYIHKENWRALVDINLGIGYLLTDYEAGSELLRMGDRYQIKWGIKKCAYNVSIAKEQMETSEAVNNSFHNFMF